MIPRETLHLAIAAYFGGDTQVLKLARKYRRRTNKPKVRRAMRTVLQHPHSASRLAKEIYDDGNETK